MKLDIKDDELRHHGEMSFYRQYFYNIANANRRVSRSFDTLDVEVSNTTGDSMLSFDEGTVEIDYEA